MEFLKRSKILILGFALLGASGAWAQALYPSWAYSRDIHINTTASGANTSSSVSNFPVLVRLDASNFDFSQAASDGSDIRFETSSQTGALSYEIERWDAAAQKAEIWVKISTIQYNDNTQFFRMFWGKTGQTTESSSANVFQYTNGFQGVWHLGEDGNTSANGYGDATSNANHGTGSALTNSSDVTAVSGLGQNFNGASNQSIDFGTASTLHSSTSLTLEAWINPTSLSASRAILGKANSSNANPFHEYLLGIDGTGTKASFSLTTAGALNTLNGTTALSNGTWYHIAATFDGSTMRLYVNGALDASTSASGSVGNYSQPFLLGKYYWDNGENFDGKIDEPRFSNNTRSADWIKLEYANLKPNQKLVESFPRVWDGEGADNNWTTAANWSGDIVPTAGEDVLFDGTSNKDVTLDADAGARSLKLTGGYSGIFSFSSHQLSLNAGDADLRSGGSIVPGTGTLEFTGGGAQTLFPKSSGTSPRLTHNGAGTLLISGNPFIGGDLTITSGTVQLGAGLSHLAVGVTGSGALDFGTSNLGASGNVNMSGLTVTAASGNTLSFTGGSSINFTPKSSLTTLKLAQTGTGLTTVSNYDFTTPQLHVAAGTFALGPSRFHVVTGTVTSAGGVLDFGSSTLEVQGASVNLANLGNVSYGTGYLKFTGSGSQTFTPKDGFFHPGIIFAGSGTITLSGGSLWTSTISIQSGTVNLGSGLDHRTTDITSAAGTLNFASSQLRVEGNANLSALTGVSAGSGTLAFTGTSATQVLTPKSAANHPAITHPGSQTLQLATYNLSCAAFSQSAGSLDLNGFDITTVGDLNFTNGTSSSFTNLSGRTLTVGGNATFTGTDATTRINLNPASTWTMNVTGTAGALFASMARTNTTASATAICKNCSNGGNSSGWQFKLLWDGGGADTKWSTAANWGLDAVPNSANHVLFDATSAKDVVVDVDADVAGIQMTSAYTGTFDFSSHKVTVWTGDAELISGGPVTAGSGSLDFVGTGAQKFVPKASAVMPNVAHSASGTLTLFTNPLIAGGLTITAGTVNLGSGMTHAFTGISGAGTLDFGTSNLNASANVDFSSLTVTASSSNTLAFVGAAPQNYTPKAAVTALNLTQSGPGTTTVLTNSFTTPTLAITAGLFNLGASLGHTITNISASAGGLDFGTSFLYTSGATVDLSGLNSLTATSGGLVFNGSSAQTFKPFSGSANPAISQQGSSTLTIIGNNYVTAGDITWYSGTLNLGSGLSHQCASLVGSGGGPFGNLDFGSSTVTVTGDVNLTQTTTLTPGTGRIIFNGASTQNIYMLTGATLPILEHANSGTVQFQTGTVVCKGFIQSAGTLNFNTRNLTVNNSGNFSLTNGTSSSFSGLAGRTITVAGTATLVGQTGNLLNLNPGSAWTFNVSGALTASWANVANGNASGSQGACSNCTMGSGNTNWANTLVWDGGGSDNNWNTAANWSNDAVPTSADGVVFDGTSIKDVTLNVVGNNGGFKLTSGYTGIFNFGTQSLSIYSGTADFRTGGTIVPGSGLVYFLGSGAQTLIPPPGQALPNLQRTSTGTVTITTNPLIANDVILPAGGTLNLGSGLSHSINGFGSNGVAGGTLNFGTSNLSATSGVDFHLITLVTPGTNTLTFTSPSTQQYYQPNAANTGLILVQAGAGTTTVATTDFTTPSLTISAGTFQLGTGRNHGTGSLSMTGGTLEFGSSGLAVSGASIDFTSAAGILPGTGTLSFTGSSAQTFKPRSGSGCPAIVQNGSGGTTLSTNPMLAGALTIVSGTLDLGSGLAHSAASLATSGGGLTFGSSSLNINTGNANLSGLGSFSAGTGAMAFSAASGTQIFTPKSGATHPSVTHSAAGTLQIAGNALTCKGFNQSAGSLDLNGFDFTTVSGGNFTISNGNSTSLINLGGRTFTVAGSMSLTGSSGASKIGLSSGSTWFPNVAGSLAANLAVLGYSNATGSAGPGTCTSCEDLDGNTNWILPVTWDGGGSDNSWSTANNWSSKHEPSYNQDVIFNNTSTKDANLGANAFAKSLTFNPSYTGTFGFSSFSLTIATGNADFRSGGSISAGSGSLTFTSASAQTLIPKSGGTLPAITLNGSGGVTLATNNLTAGDLTLTQGTLDLGTGFTHTVGNISPASSGGLVFNNSTLNATGSSVSFNNLGTLNYGTGTLAFQGASAQTFTPKSGVFHPKFKQDGAGGTTLVGGNFTTSGLSLVSGTFHLGASHYIVANQMNVTGGGLDFGSSTLETGAATVDFSPLSIVTAGTGTLAFWSGSAITFTPKSLATHPNISIDGGGTVTLAGNAYYGGSINLIAGGLNLGTGFTHGITGLTISGGTLNFAGSTLELSGGSANLTALTTLTPGTGGLRFSATSGTQVLTPKSGVTHPPVSHAGAGVLQLAVNDLICKGFNHTAGSLDLNGRNITTVSGGDLTIGYADASTMIGLGGRTITVAGNADFFGQTSASPLNLNPGSSWTLAVTGNLTGTLATVANSIASLSAGACNNCSMQAGNSNWLNTVAWDGGGPDNNWTTASNWASDAAPQSGEAVVFNSTSVKNAVLDASAGVASISFASGYTGNFSFSNFNLTVLSGDADFRSGGTFTAGSGDLVLSQSGTNSLYPKSGAVFPNIVKVGAGTTTIAGAGLSAGNVTLSAGTTNLGSGLVHTVAAFTTNPGGTQLDFGSSTLRASGATVDLSGLSSLTTGSGLLELNGASPQNFTAFGGASNPDIKQSGAGGTALQSNLNSATLTVSGGIFGLGSGHTVTLGNFTATGGGLNFGTSSMNITGSGADFSALAGITPGSATLQFSGSSAQTFTPRSGSTFPAISLTGNGGVTLAGNGLNTPSLSLGAGSLNLGTGLVHSIGDMIITGGGLTFGSSTLSTASSTVDFGTLSAFTANAGTLDFTLGSGTQIFTPYVSGTAPNLIHSGAATLRFSTHDVNCLSFTNSAGSVDFNAMNLTVSAGGGLSFSNAASNTMTNLGGRILTVAGNASFAGAAGNLMNLDPGTAWTLAVSGTLTASRVNLAHCAATGTAGTASVSADGGANTGWSFADTWTGGGSDNFWATAANWASGIAPGATIAVLFDNTSVKNATLGAGASAKSVTFASGYTGTFDFGASALTIHSGNADFRSGGSFTAGTGTLAFVGTSGTQTLFPKSGAVLPDIVQNGSGTTTISGNPLTAGNLTISAGTFDMGTGGTQSFKSITGSGILNLESVTLEASGNVDFSGLAGFTESLPNLLSFTGSGSQTYTPYPSGFALRLAQNGTGTVTFLANVTAGNLAIASGTVNLGASRVHTVTNFSITGGTLDFGSSGLRAKGTLVDFSPLSALVAGSGYLEFNGLGAQTFTPTASATLPDLRQNGSVGTTLAGSIQAAGGLLVSSGTFDLGTSFTHSIASFSSTGGGLAFGGSTLLVTTGNADFSALSALTAGSGSLGFQAASGTQILTPKSGAGLPFISHTGTGVLQLGGSDLSAAGLHLYIGSFDFGGRNVALSGTLNVSTPGASLIGLAGRTITTGGDAVLYGLPGSHLVLNPGQAWTLDVSGALMVVNSDLGGCQATETAGIADSSLNLGGNVNWTFIDSIPPVNVAGFTATALDGHRVQMSWSAPSDPDADSVFLRYRTDGAYPANRTDGTLWRGVPKSRVSDTATGLADKQVFNFAAFVKDSSGNWSPPLPSARDTSRTPDVTPPANVTALVATALGPSSVALAWTASATADADTVMIRYRTDNTYPLNTTDGTFWKKVPVARVTDTLTGLTGNTVYSMGLFVRDSSGNFCNRAASAQDTALYQAPVTGSIVIADITGRTRDADPALTFTASGADSLRYSLLADTATAAWKGIRAKDSVDMAPGADGKRIATVQYKNVFGTRSAWFRDTTTLDRGGPVVIVNVPAVASYLTWPNLVAGKALDSLTGTDTVFALRQREADNQFFNGTAWGAPDTARLRTDSTFSLPLSTTTMASGFYNFTAWAKDKLGNVSAPVVKRVRYDSNRAPSVAASNLADTVAQNQQVSWTLDLGDLDLGDTVKTVTAAIPAWLAKTEAPDTARNGFAAHRIYALSGKPRQADVGQHTVSVQASDVGGQVFTFTKTITVLDVNDAPVFAAGQDSMTVKEDSVTRRVVHFSDPDPADKPVLTVVSAPVWVSLADSTLTFAPGSRDVGPAQVRLLAYDGKLLDTLDIAVNVINVNDAPVAFPGSAWDSVMHWSERGVDSFTVVVVDMDKNDPVNLATALPDFISVKSTLDGSGYNRYFRFTVLPAQKDAGSYNLKLKFLDAAGASGTVSLRATVAAVNDVPVAAIQSIETSAGAARAALDVIDADGSLAFTRFHYRVVNAAGDTVRSGICPAPPLYLYPLADGEYRLAVRAEDEAGLKQSAYALANFTISGASTLALDSARWNMIGYPGRALATSALGAGAAAATWDEAASDGSPLGRYATGKSADSLSRGKGYWIKTARRANLTVTQADLLDKPFVLKLARGKQGWNQIGNPYPFYLDLSATGFIFWGWDADKRDLVDAKGLLKPWGAYWVQVGRDTALTLKGEPWFPASGKGAGALAKGVGESNAPGFRHAGDWSLQLSLTAGAYRDQANFLGIRPVTPTAGSAAGSGSEAATDLSGLLADAPKFGDYIALHFEKASEALGGETPIGEKSGGETVVNGYAADYRSSLGGDEAWWDFSVENSASGQSQAALSLPGLAELGRAGLYAFLVRAGQVSALSAETPATLAMDGATTHYSIVVTPHADFAARLKGEFSISQNFPNPVVAQTTFRFYLPQAWGAEGKRMDKSYRLRLNVYDFSGRLAARVAEGAFRPGMHTLLWKPQGLGGNGLPKGAYVYRLEIPGMAKTMKLIIK